MRRILIVGNSGGGKSTLARRLGEKLKLPVIHLDVIFWKPGWVEIGDDLFRVEVERALQGSDWICDGNFRGTWDLRMPLADTIVWLDLPRLRCLFRAIKRVVTYRGRRTRPDMAEGCDEKFDPAFYRFIWTYNAKVAPQLEAAIASYGRHARIVRLKSDQEIDAFVASLPQA
jgi:adenylate kinase family enzyme